jgi:lambda family phage portal protein
VGILSVLAPGIAARRAEARARITRAETSVLAEAKRAEVIQSYDAARQGGRMSGWSRPHTSAATETQGALPYLRAAGRDLVRNSPHASRAVRILSTHIAGTGVRPRAMVEARSADAKEAIQRVTRSEWDRFVENCDLSGQLDFYGQQRLMMRAVVEGGEALRIWTPENAGGRLFWRCEVVEGDLLDHQKNEVRPDGSRIVQGVEFDAVGRRVAYWMHRVHPGELYAGLGTLSDVQRIPAEYVDHVFEVLRPGQVRGVSWFAPSATTLRDVDDLAEAEIVRKKLEACISMVITNANEDGAPGSALGVSGPGDEPAMTQADGTPIERMQPGMVVEARPGWSVDFNAPPASDGLAEHMRERLHAVAAGVGATYFQMTGDLSQANYSSMRAGELDFNRLVDVWQQDLMIVQSGRRAWRRVMTAAQTNGALRIPQIPPAKWVPPERPWVDPLKDAQAAVMMTAAGFDSPLDVVQRSGRAPEEIVEDIRRWREMTDGLGLSGGADPADSTKRESDDDERPDDT